MARKTKRVKRRPSRTGRGGRSNARYSTLTRIITFRCPNDIVEQLDQTARQESVSRSQLISAWLREALSDTTGKKVSGSELFA